MYNMTGYFHSEITYFSRLLEAGSRGARDRDGAREERWMKTTSRHGEEQGAHPRILFSR